MRLLTKPPPSCGSLVTIPRNRATTENTIPAIIMIAAGFFTAVIAVLIIGDSVGASAVADAASVVVVAGAVIIAGACAVVVVIDVAADAAGDAPIATATSGGTAVLDAAGSAVVDVDALGVASTAAGTGAVVVVDVAFVIVDAVAFDAEVNTAKFDVVAFAISIVVFVQVLLVNSYQSALQTIRESRRIKSKLPRGGNIFTRSR